MDANTNSLNWFEIPVDDLGRAKRFYEEVFLIEMEEMQMGETSMAFFPWKGGSGKANGALAKSADHKPSSEGSLIYLNANPAMDDTLARVEGAGGQVVLPKMNIGENGNIAFILDTEGNKVGIHSNE